MLIEIVEKGLCQNQGAKVVKKCGISPKKWLLD